MGRSARLFFFFSTQFQSHACRLHYFTSEEMSEAEKLKNVLRFSISMCLNIESPPIQKKANAVKSESSSSAPPAERMNLPRSRQAITGELLLLLLLFLLRRQTGNVPACLIGASCCNAADKELSKRIRTQLEGTNRRAEGVGLLRGAATEGAGLLKLPLSLSLSLAAIF